jgi:predicted nucleic acid-binding protein
MKSIKLTKQSVLVDSSAVIAGFSKNDALRSRAMPVWRKLLSAPFRLFIPFEVIIETITRIKQKGSAIEAIQLYEILSNFQAKKKITVLWSSSKTYRLAIEIFRQNPSPKTFSFTDANILAHMKKNNIPTLFTFDRDFKKLGVKILPPQ